LKPLGYILLLLGYFSVAQHHSQLTVAVNNETKSLTVSQELTYFNQSHDTLNHLVLNDWMNGYTSKNTPMGERFSDEFERSFLLAKEKDRGRTSNLTMIDATNSLLTWERDGNHPDVVQIRLRKPLLPDEKTTITLTYQVKIPNAKFTNYGFGERGNLYLKNCFLAPSRYENHEFVKYNNLNLDDSANDLTDFDVTVTIPQNKVLSTDLDVVSKTEENNQIRYVLTGRNRLDFNLFLDEKSVFSVYKNGELEVVSDLNDTRLNDIQKALVIDKIVTYVSEQLGSYPHQKITVAQADYERNPFYGLNQLPVFISPFSDEFLFEIKFLKTYLNNYLHTTQRLDPRTDNWVFDAIQVYVMMNYIQEFHPDAKMMGSVAKLRLVRGYHMVSLDFNGQYSYFYMLMARKNLDQPLNNSKNTLIRFNDKIASKYRAGLSLRYLDSYLGNEVVPGSIKQFILLNRTKQTSSKDFETLLTNNSPKKINWFFDKIIASRDLIDYKFESVSRTQDSISFKLNNKTETNVPIPVYGIKDRNIVFKKWIDTFSKDSVFTVPRLEADKIVINYKNEVPEFNLRNNWRSLKGFRLNNRPIKFNFMKDLEDPNYNQILYVPTLEYNLYDGFLPGFRFHNKTILEKPFIFDVNPTISTRTRNFSGKALFYVNQYNRDSHLYNIKYMLGGHYLHYAPDAYYSKIAPTVYLNFRPDDYRDNHKSTIIIKEVMLDKQKSAYTTSTDMETYQVFNAKYIDNKTEVAHHFHFLGDFQYSATFGKLASEIQYRKLFDDNRQLNLRVFAGTFLHNKTTTDYFDFGLDRPTDYLFESEYIGRSEKTGIFSQQSIIMDGFFKSKLQTRTANRWMITANACYGIWNWVEAYGDIGAIKNKETCSRFVYDSGIRLNLVTDYFELYLPVYSSLGWEVGQKNYGERIRFIITFRPDTLINLFTRKWF